MNFVALPLAGSVGCDCGISWSSSLGFVVVVFCLFVLVRFWLLFDVPKKSLKHFDTYLVFAPKS